MEHSNMMHIFRTLIHRDKSDIHGRLGAPRICYPTLWAYHQNGLWMVLGFADEYCGAEGAAEVSSLTVYDENLTLRWSRGIQLLPADWSAYNSFDAFLDAYDAPHGSLLSGGNMFYYLTETGSIVYISPQDEERLTVSETTLTDLAEQLSAEH